MPLLYNVSRSFYSYFAVEKKNPDHSPLGNNHFRHDTHSSKLSGISISGRSAQRPISQLITDVHIPALLFAVSILGCGVWATRSTSDVTLKRPELFHKCLPPRHILVHNFQAIDLFRAKVNTTTDWRGSKSRRNNRDRCLHCPKSHEKYVARLIVQVTQIPFAMELLVVMPPYSESRIRYATAE